MLAKLEPLVQDADESVRKVCSFRNKFLCSQNIIYLHIWGKKNVAVGNNVKNVATISSVWYYCIADIHTNIYRRLFPEYLDIWLSLLHCFAISYDCFKLYKTSAIVKQYGMSCIYTETWTHANNYYEWLKHKASFFSLLYIYSSSICI